MGDCNIKFEPSGIEGIVPIGTYLAAAAKRIGIRGFECDLLLGVHDCSVIVSAGSELLSSVSEAEREILGDEAIAQGNRLACFSVIESEGDIVVMERTEEEDVASEEVESEADDYKKKFAEMPLEKKIANLVELEAMAMNETLSFIFNSPFKVADKALDVLAEFGFRKEEDERKAARPNVSKVSVGKQKSARAGSSGARKPGRKKKDKSETSAMEGE